MRVETWTSNKGAEEIHHFIPDTQTYLFGINAKLLGYGCYHDVMKIVTERLNLLEGYQRRLKELEQDAIHNTKGT